MKITKVYYEKKVKTETVGVEMQVDPHENPDKILMAAKDWCNKKFGHGSEN